MVKKVIYVLGWSMGLLFATFPDLFKGELDFHMSEMMMKDVCEVYMFPLLMALSLFVVDVWYVFEQERSQRSQEPTYVIGVIAMIGAFLFGLLYTVSSQPCPIIGFIVSWIALTIMKFIKTSKCDEKGKELVFVGRVVNDN